jgi:hypothetical protein
MNKMDETHRSLVKRFYLDARSIPDFIKGRYAEHKKCYDIASFQFEVLSPLFSKDILKKGFIEDVFVEMCDGFEEMIDTEPSLALAYFDYFRELLNYYRMESLDYELYEVAENLTYFLRIYKKIVVGND